MSALTEQDNDAEEDGNNGPRAQPCAHDSVHIGAVPVGVALANLHAKDGDIRFGGIPRICDYDRNFINPSFKKFYLQIKLSEITYMRKEEVWWVVNTSYGKKTRSIFQSAFTT